VQRSRTKEGCDPQNLSLGSALLNPVPNPYQGRVPGAFGGATITRQQSLRPYPYYANITVQSPHMGSSTVEFPVLVILTVPLQGAREGKARHTVADQLAAVRLQKEMAHVEQLREHSDRRLADGRRFCVCAVQDLAGDCFFDAPGSHEIETILAPNLGSRRCQAPSLQRHILGNLAGMGKRRSRSIAADDAALSTVLDAGATGGPANAHGVAYQLQIALYEALPILAETLAAPYKDLMITLEVRAIHDQGITRWDLGIGAATRLLEVKTNASAPM